MKKGRIADLVLILAVAMWGSTYYVIKHEVANVEPFMLNAIRFGIASLVISAAFKKRMSLDRNTLKYGIILGLLMFTFYLTGAFGARLTSVSNAGFLCCLAVIITPLIEFFVIKKNIEKKIAIIAVCTLIGVGCLTLGGEFSFGIGDAVCIMCSFAFAVNIIVTEKAVQEENLDPVAIAGIQVVIVCILSLFSSFIFEKNAMHITSMREVAALLYLALFCTAFTAVAIPSCQKYTTASRMGIIGSFESLVSAIIGFIFVGERLGAVGYIGAVILFVCIVSMEIDFEDVIGRFKGRRIDR